MVLEILFGNDWPLSWQIYLLNSDLKKSNNGT